MNAASNDQHPEQYPEVRPSVVAALAGISDPEHLTDDQHAAALQANTAEVRQAGTLHALAALQHYEDAGLLHRTTILDLDLRTALAVAACVGSLRDWWTRPELRDQPLGQVLKLADPSAVTWCVWQLRYAGLLPADYEAPQDHVTGGAP